MRKSLLHVVACCIALLPLARADAAPYGGLGPGKSFTLTVTERVSTRKLNDGKTKNAAVPEGIPDYKIGQKVEFTIGKNGKLTAKGLSLPFKSANSSTNRYDKPASNETNTAGVTKNAKGKPTAVALKFTSNRLRVQPTGIDLIKRTVSYSLK